MRTKDDTIRSRINISLAVGHQLFLANLAREKNTTLSGIVEYIIDEYMRLKTIEFDEEKKEEQLKEDLKSYEIVKPYN